MAEPPRDFSTNGGGGGGGVIQSPSSCKLVYQKVVITKILGKLSKNAISRNYKL